MTSLITKLDLVCTFNQSSKTNQRFGWFELVTFTSPVEKTTYKLKRILITEEIAH